jgi:hypothetical protein
MSRSIAMGTLALLASVASWAGTVTLASTSATNQRWKDAGHTLYAESYRSSYTYQQAQVVVAYEDRADSLVGRLVAANLKPNFAYQIKLEAAPGSDCAERLGSVGRYWREEWIGGAWSDGKNLNDKGNGSVPSPNDLSYVATRDMVDTDSPTGLNYRFTTYLLLGYMITDGNGNGTVDLRMDSSYHVLWREDQHLPGASDGPSVSRTFSPVASSPAYDSAGAEQTVAVFGEWERLPTGGLRLPDGDYDLKLVMTEESFHQSRDEFDGNWATVLSGQIAFSSGNAPVFATQPVSVLARSGDTVQFAVTLEGAADSIAWYRDGVKIESAESLTLDLAAVAPADGGDYTCVASNAFGDTQSRSAALMVRDDLRTEVEYAQAVGERDDQISALQSQVDSMFTAGEVDAAIETARPDRDGDGYTDAQEAEQGSDPDLYAIPLEPGWNLVSLARVPEDDTVAGIFGDEATHIVGRVWRWIPALGRYEPVDALAPQQGHWVFWNGEPTEIPITLPEHGL